MTDLSLWSLLLSAFLSSTLLPGGSEAVLAWLTHEQGHALWWLLAVASVGNTLGGMSSWLIGRLIAIRYPLIASDEENLHHEDTKSRRKHYPSCLRAFVVRFYNPAAGNKSDEGRGTSNEGKQDSFGQSVGRSGCAAIDLCGCKAHRGAAAPAIRKADFDLPRHSSLVPRPSAKAVQRLRRWGAPVLLLSWLPVIGDPLCVAAGWLRIHWLLSLVLIGIGKTARYAVVVFVFM